MICGLTGRGNDAAATIIEGMSRPACGQAHALPAGGRLAKDHKSLLAARVLMMPQFARRRYVPQFERGLEC